MAVKTRFRASVLRSRFVFHARRSRVRIDSRSSRSPHVRALTQSRSGFVFTTVATLLIGILIIFATSETSTLTRTVTQTARIHTMDSYLDNLEADLPRVAYIAGFRSLIAMEEHVSATGAFLTDVDVAFAEAFTNGTINATPYAILDDSTFSSFAQRFASLAVQQGMDSNLSLNSLHVYHETPDAITLAMNFTLVLADSAGSASFTRPVTIHVTVPVTDIKDPLYSIGTQGRAPHPIRFSNLTRPFITPTNDTTQLQILVNNSLYIEDVNGPSVLMRFTGNYSASPHGIASFVNIREFITQGLAISTCHSVVDYRYFGTANTVPNRLIVNMDSDEFWLADSDLALADATEKTVGVKPCT